MLVGGSLLVRVPSGDRKSSFYFDSRDDKRERDNIDVCEIYCRLPIESVTRRTRVTACTTS